MKKNILFIACCIGLMLFASCKKDPVAPTIRLYDGEVCVPENAQVFSGDPIVVGFKATGEKLTKIEVSITQNNIVLAQDAKAIDAEDFTYVKDFTIDASGIVTITGTVTDAAGQTATKSFDIVYNEKPNAKFLGIYQGKAYFTGTMEASIAGMEPMHQDVTDQEMPITLTVTEGVSMNEVICKINDQEETAVGTVEGDKLSIVLTDLPYTFDYDMNGFSISPTLIMNLNLTATLAEGQLTLEGTCNGDGEVNVFFYTGTMAIDGNISGTLDKTE